MDKDISLAGCVNVIRTTETDGQIHNTGCISTLFLEKKSQNNKIFLWWSNNLLFDGFTYNTRGHFAHCSYFSLPLRGS